jgi:hypothetical protein
MPETYARNARQLQALEAKLLPARTWKTECIIIWGQAGAGKSTYAESLCEPGKIFRLDSKNNDKLWWDGFDPLLHIYVIVDDFYGWFRFTEWLKLTDKFDYSVEIKGAMTKFLARRIIFTSNTRPENWYKFESNPNFDREAFVRRIDYCYHVTGKPENAVWTDYLPQLKSWSQLQLQGSLEGNIPGVAPSRLEQLNAELNRHYGSII